MKLNENSTLLPNLPASIFRKNILPKVKSSSSGSIPIWRGGYINSVINETTYQIPIIGYLDFPNNQGTYWLVGTEWVDTINNVPAGGFPNISVNTAGWSNISVDLILNNSIISSNIIQNNTVAPNRLNGTLVSNDGTWNVNKSGLFVKLTRNSSTTGISGEVEGRNLLNLKYQYMARDMRGGMVLAYEGSGIPQEPITTQWQTPLYINGNVYDQSKMQISRSLQNGVCMIVQHQINFNGGSDVSIVGVWKSDIPWGSSNIADHFECLNPQDKDKISVSLMGSNQVNVNITQDVIFNIHKTATLSNQCYCVFKYGTNLEYGVVVQLIN